MLKKLKLPAKKLLIPYFLVIAILLAVFCLYHVYYAKRIIPGVRLGKVNVGGMAYTEALGTLQDFYGNSDQKIVLNIDSYSHELLLSDVEFEYQWEVSVSRAFEVGRTGNIYIDSKDKIAGLVKPLWIRLHYDFDNLLLGQKLSVIGGEIEEPAKNSEFVLSGSSLKITPSAVGAKVISGDLYTLIIDSFDNMNFGEKNLPMMVDRPEISEEDLQSVLDEARKIVFSSLKIVYEEKSWVLTSVQKLEMLSVNKKGEFSLNEKKFAAYVQSLELEVNRQPKGLVTETDGDEVVTFEMVEKGRGIDVEEFSSDFKSAFINSKPKVTLPMMETGEPSAASEYGIHELLGEGNSKFYGSAKERIHNLTLAAERTSGVLVPPGGIYSMNESIGEISGVTGYDSAYIIKDGKTILGEGGGVCQTSTTLFRAILNSGLPVMERHPHAYRVVYYELDSTVGFDASVYQPSLDLKFKNDTENYVLVQSSADLGKSVLTFKIYGTPDGREVEITEPVVTNVSPPPEALYEDDPTLPKGEVKQVDFAAWGASVTFSRTVMMDEEVLYADTFKSNYRPWQAVYLVGTKE